MDLSESGDVFCNVEQDQLKLKVLQSKLAVSLADVQEELYECLLTVQELAPKYYTLVQDCEEQLKAFADTNSLAPQILQRHQNEKRLLNEVHLQHSSLKETLDCFDFLRNLKELLKGVECDAGQPMSAFLLGSNTYETCPSPSSVSSTHPVLNLEEIKTWLQKCHDAQVQRLNLHDSSVHQLLSKEVTSVTMTVMELVIQEWRHCIVESGAQQNQTFLYRLEFCRAPAHFATLLTIYQLASQIKTAGGIGSSGSSSSSWHLPIRTFLERFYTTAVQNPMVRPVLQDSHLLLSLRRATTSVPEEELSARVSVKEASDTEGPNTDQTAATANSGKTPAADPNVVLPQLEQLFSLLHTYVFAHPVVEPSEGKENRRGSTSSSPMSLGELMAPFILENLSTDLIKLSLTPTLPRSREELQIYCKSTVTTVESFCQAMNQLFPHVNPSPLERVRQFVHESRRLFEERLDELVLGKARELLQENLFSTSVVSEDTPGVFTTDTGVILLKPSPDTAVQQPGLAEMRQILSDDVDHRRLKFPQCHVSEGFIRLLQYIREVMLESVKLAARHHHDNSHSADQASNRVHKTSQSRCESSEESMKVQQDSEQLDETDESESCDESHNTLACGQGVNLSLLRGILSLVLYVGPSMHQDSLRETTQAAALFHNDCMFIAHGILAHLGPELLQLSQQRCATSNNPSIGKEDTTTAGTLVDFVSPLRDLAQRTLTARLNQVRDELQTTWTAARPFVNLGKKTDSALRGCVMQVKQVDRQWRVLPVKLHQKEMGSLVEFLVSQVLAELLTMEDILATDASMWASLLAKMRKELVSVFLPSVESKDADSVPANVLNVTASQLVPSWFRAVEVETLMSCSLAQIEDRWLSGKGPLAMHLKAQEVRHLVRALFADSEMRAAFLSKLG